MRKVVSCLLALAAILLSAAEFTDAEWAAMRREMLAKPRRVILDNDGCDALNFPADKEITLENFYGQMMTPMLGCEFDVLLYCPNTTGFAVTSKTKTGHRRLKSPDDKNLRNITRDLEEKFGADPATLAQRFAREHGFEFVMSMRGNDDHDAYYPAAMSEFKEKHPELLVGGKEASRRPRVGSWTAYDFALKEVRDLFKTMVCEWFDEYDLDGFSIDFQRGSVYFKSVAQGGEASREEMELMTQMLREIRAYAETVARRRGRPMYYMFRAPDSAEVCRHMGLDIETWMREGLFDYYAAGGDMGHFTPYADSVALAHKYGLKCLISQDISWLMEPSGLFTRNTDARFSGDFAAAAAAGADGIYMFNMIYAMGFFPLVRRNPAEFREVNKRYFVTLQRPRSLFPGQPAPGQGGFLPALYDQYPLHLTDDEPHDYLLEIGDDFGALPQGEPRPSATLALKTAAAAKEAVAVAVNGHAAAFASQKGDVALFDVPLEALKPGQNTLTITAKTVFKPEERLILSGKEILEGTNQPPWRRLFPGSGAAGAEAIVDGAYRLKSTEKGPVNLMYPLSGIAGQAVQVRVEAKVEADSAVGAATLRVANGRYVEVLDLLPDRVRLRYSAHQAAVDATVFHEYRLTISREGKVELLLDGRPLLEGRLSPNATDPKLQLKGYHFDMPGMHDSSILIGGLDIGAAGASHWRNLRLLGGAASVEDAVLNVTFPPKPTAALKAVLERSELPYVYRQECADGVFKETDGVKRAYPVPLKAAEGLPGVAFDHDVGEYSAVQLEDFPPLREARRFMVAEWKVTCTKPPRKEGDFNFQAVLRPLSLKTAGRQWNFSVRSAEGTVTTPFGTCGVPDGAQILKAVIDCQTGDALLLADGQVLSGGKAAEQPADSYTFYGDGSALISGVAVLEYLRIAHFDE